MEDNSEILSKMEYETSCKPKRKDHLMRHIEWCKKIELIANGEVKFKFYKSRIFKKGYVAECEITNYKKEDHKTRKYVQRDTSCVNALMQIYHQIRDML